ncbi:MAG: flagellar assembly protein FliH [Oligoflexia bacterium]|nr:flagellar assembly protein FliH [Oligoflexia bacterium]
MAEEQGFTAETSGPNQTDYRPTEYADASWEIVGAVSDVQTFEPLPIEVIPEERLKVDPMFRDYGGIPDQKLQRWHLPEHLALEQNRKHEEVELDPELAPQTMTKRELDQLLQAERERGRAEAGAEAEQILNQKLSEIKEGFINVLQDLNRQITEHAHQTEVEAVNLALAISKRIINQAVEINPEYIRPIIDEALELGGGSAVKKVRVSPPDLEFINYAGIAEQLKSAESHWQFEADPTIKSGCVLETVAGEVDFQLDQTWERVKEHIVKVIR